MVSYPIQPKDHSSAFLFHLDERRAFASYKYIRRPTSAVSVEAAILAVGNSVKAQTFLVCTKPEQSGTMRATLLIATLKLTMIARVGCGWGWR
jgi:hypothetical protein